MQLSRLAFAGPVVALVLLGACTIGGGGSSSGGAGGGTVSGSGSVGAVRPPMPPANDLAADCPPAVPRSGALCSFEAVCEYGDAADPACNVTARCEGQDQLAWTIETGAACPSTCPKRFDERAPGDSCGEPLCTYLEATCGCVGATGATGDGGAGEGGSADGGSGDEGGTLGRWQCVRPGNGCPARRPVAGTGCTQTGLACDYGACLFGGTGLTLECTGIHWLETEATCP